jgi:hypothetical protein
MLQVNFEPELKKKLSPPSPQEVSLQHAWLVCAILGFGISLCYDTINY